MIRSDKGYVLNRNHRNCSLLARKGDVMLLSFKAKNFACFPNDFGICMYACTQFEWNNRVTPIEAGEFKVLKKCGIFGANSSGKSYVLKAISTFLTVIYHGHIDYGTQAQSYFKTSIPFALNVKNKLMTSSFEIEFYLGNSVYKYAMETYRDKIVKERLKQSNLPAHLSESPDYKSKTIFDIKYFDLIEIEKKTKMQQKRLLN